MLKKIKNMIKKNPDPAKPSFGTNPSDPWSTKANIAEGVGLNDYLMSRGINPVNLSPETKISYAKSSSYLKWKQERNFSSGVKLHGESVDKVDTITVDIPLMIRLLELAREDVKTDMELHKITERLIEIRGKGMLSMEDYDFIANGKTKIKEEILDESPKEGGQRRFSGMYNPAPKGTFAYDQAMRKKKHDEIEKNQSKDGSGMTAAIDRLQKHLNKEEVEQIDELNKDTLKSYRDKSMASIKNARKNRDAAEPGKNMSKGFADLYAKSDAIAKKRAKGLAGYLQRKHGMKPGYPDERKTTSENTLDPLAATEAPCDCANGGETTSRKSQMSKSARMIKSLYKHLNMKEETYDWEKDDKSSQEKPYGKKPKVDTLDKTGTLGDTKPEARAVMKGGTTLTGKPRDMVEIDPSMKQRPGQPDKGASLKDK